MFKSNVGVIDLRYCIAVQPSGEKSKKFFFDVITGSSPPQGFAAESQQEREDWITALNDFLFSKRAVSIYRNFGKFSAFKIFDSHCKR